MAGSIYNEQARSRALAIIAKQLAVADPSNPVLLHRALAAAEVIPDDGIRSSMILRIRVLNRDGMLDEMSRWRLRSLGASINLLALFLRYSHDETTAESIGLAVLQVAGQAPVGAENLCHQAIFMNHAPCAVTPLDPELIQVCDAVG